MTNTQRKFYADTNMVPNLPSNKGRLRSALNIFECDEIIKALMENDYNQTRTASWLGISRRSLIHKMEKYSLKAPPRARMENN